MGSSRRKSNKVNLRAGGRATAKPNDSRRRGADCFSQLGIVMIVFMAVPLLRNLAMSGNKVLSGICYLVPSSATFEGVMVLAEGGYYNT